MSREGGAMREGETGIHIISNKPPYLKLMLKDVIQNLYFRAIHNNKYLTNGIVQYNTHTKNNYSTAHFQHIKEHHTYYTNYTLIAPHIHSTRIQWNKMQYLSLV